MTKGTTGACFRQLNVHRVSIHKNFFMSLLLNSVMVIVFKCVVILNELNGPAKIPSIAEQVSRQATELDGIADFFVSFVCI